MPPLSYPPFGSPGVQISVATVWASVSAWLSLEEEEEEGPDCWPGSELIVMFKLISAVS
jgi:hypothetical protein